MHANIKKQRTPGGFSPADYKQAADVIEKKLSPKADIAVVLGTGLSVFADQLADRTELPYTEIPYFHATGVDSHRGILYYGTFAGKKLLVFAGRFHYYEGYEMAVSAFYIYVLKLLGIKTVVLTNAAGGVNEQYQPGDLMLIEDHIKLAAAGPCRGLNLDQFGPRFFDMSDVYTKVYRKRIQSWAEENDFPLHEGVYFYMPGPQFETPAEIRAIRNLGGDAVGMSTVAEAIACAHCGLHVVGISCITNMAAGMLDQAITSQEVTETTQKVSGRFSKLMEGVVQSIVQNEGGSFDAIFRHNLSERKF